MVYQTAFASARIAAAVPAEPSNSCHGRHVARPLFQTHHRLLAAGPRAPPLAASETWSPSARRVRRAALPALGLVPSPEDPETSGSVDAAVGVEASTDSDGQAVQIDLDLPRRSLLVTFTCNRCDGRTERLVNPIAWNKGMVMAQCGKCQVWHKLADAANLVEEIRYADLED